MPQARRVTIDMAAVKRLDTYGAWLLERLVRDFKSRGAATEVVGLSETYRPLMDEVRGIDLAKWDAHDEFEPDQQRARFDRRDDLHGLSLLPRRLEHAWRGGGRIRPRAYASAPLPLHLDGASPRQCRLARGADHPADHLPDRLHHRAARHIPLQQIRRRHLRSGHGRHPGDARDRRLDRRHHGGGPLRLGLHRRARLDEDARGGRRAAHHGLRSGRGPGACRA